MFREFQENIGLMTKEELWLEKAEAINKSLENTALALIANAKSGDPEDIIKIRFRQILQIGKLDLLMILSKPIPKYPPGGLHPGGRAVVGENGPEIIQFPFPDNTNNLKA